LASAAIEANFFCRPQARIPSVNAIAPGEINTAILSPGTEEIVAHQIPMHRLGTPDEVAKIIYVLCTETSSYMNGAEIHINGGQHV
jgi:NAD(P)-dependent dehydrogenase (short-subunit alcohol dehydrogenase family)